MDDIGIDFARLTDAMELATDPELTRLLVASPAGSPIDLVPLRGAETRRLLRPELPPILVVGGSGGAGVTSTVLGLAAAAATHDDDGELWPCAVDATAYGGDLALRGCDAVVPVATVQSWLDTDRPGLPSAVDACTGHTSTGARILHRHPGPLPRRETYVSVHHHLTQAGAMPIYDAGSPVANRLTAPLLADPRIALAVVTTARADALNRLRTAMTWLDEQFGEFMVSRAVLVVTQQYPDPGGTATAAAEHVRAHLGQWVRAVVSIPYDPHLATGLTVSWQSLHATTRQAYRNLLGALQ